MLLSDPVPGVEYYPKVELPNTPKQNRLLPLLLITYWNSGRPFAKDTMYFGLGCREMKLKLNRKNLCCWLTFIVVEGAMQAAGVGKSLTALSSYEPCEPWHRQDVFTAAVVAWLRGSNQQLVIGF